MERIAFMTLFNKASDQLDKRELKRILRSNIRAIKNEDKENILYITMMEELAELSQEISKHVRGRNNKNQIIEEIADSLISIAYLQELCGISTSDIYKAINVKKDRIERVISERGIYL